MSSKFSLVSVVADQYGTLVDAKTGKRRIEDFVVVLGVPGATAALSRYVGWRIEIVGELISAVAIITALLFGLVIFLFQLRIQLGDPERADRIPRSAIRLVDEMFTNVAYAIVVGFVVTGVTLIGAATRVDPAGELPVQPIGPTLTCLILGLLIHFLLVLAMCLKRLTSSYRQVATR